MAAIGWIVLIPLSSGLVFRLFDEQGHGIFYKS